MTTSPEGRLGYALACQVAELRETHQLNEIELSEQTGIPQTQIQPQ